MIFFGNDDYNFLQVLKKKCWKAQPTLILFKILMDGMESMGVNWKDYSTMDFKDGGMDGFNEDISMDGKLSGPITPRLRLLVDAASPLHSPAYFHLFHEFWRSSDCPFMSCFMMYLFPTIFAQNRFVSSMALATAKVVVWESNQKIKVSSILFSPAIQEI